MMSEHTDVYTRSMTVKFIRHYPRVGGAMTMTLTADGYGLHLDPAEIAALHDLLGRMLQCSDDSCPCYAAGEQAQRERRP